MKIAITGAAGFIGRHVLTELASQHVEIVALDQRLVQPDLYDADFEFVQLAMEDCSESTFSQIGKPDCVIHLAWGGLPNYLSLHHFQDELPLQYRFLSQLINSGLNSLVVVGTCFEYGMQSGELTETMYTQPDNPYGFAKNCLRQQLAFLQNEKPFNFSWARLFYLFGDGQAKNSLLPQLKRAVELGDSIFNMSGGEQLRDYLSIKDVAQKLVKLAMHQSNIGVVNLCSGKPISVRRLVEGWIKENDWDIQLNLGYYTYPEYEPFASWGNSSKLDHHLASLKPTNR